MDSVVKSSSSSSRSTDTTTSSISVGKFYGARNPHHTLHKLYRRRKRISLQHRQKSFESVRFPVEFQKRLCGPTASWKTFFRQKDAFEFLNNANPDLKVIGYESEQQEGGSGQRVYLVTSWPVFWHYYRQLEPSKRHHYEIIPEGQACKMYFDLEFQTETNPNRNGARMVETLIKYVCAWLKLCYSIESSSSQVLDLDSSTESKFSRHLIFTSNAAVFQDNSNMGNFVRHIFTLLWTEVKRRTHSDDKVEPSPSSTHDNAKTDAQTSDSCDKTKQLVDSSSVRNPGTIRNNSSSYKICDKDSSTHEELHLGDILKSNLQSVQNKNSSVLSNLQSVQDKNSSVLSNLQSVQDKNSSVQGSHPFNEKSLRTNQRCIKDKTRTSETVDVEERRDYEKMVKDLDADPISFFEEDSAFIDNPDGTLDSDILEFAWDDEFDSEISMLDEEELFRCDGSSNGKVGNRTDVSSLHSESCSNELLHQGMEGVGKVSHGHTKEVMALFTYEELKSLIVKNKDGDDTLFADLAVYSKNRNFRMFLSSKLGKSNPLVVSSQSRLGGQWSEENTFFSSLITNVGDSPVGTQLLEFSGGSTNHSVRPAKSSSRLRALHNPGSQAHDSGDTLQGYGCSSPYLEVDRFIQSILGGDGSAGNIRQWTYFPTTQVIMYDIAGYRWCANIGRQHRSNNIMYVVDISRAVYYQKCYDPDCQRIGYKSEDQQLPPECLPWLQLMTDDSDDILTPATITGDSQTPTHVVDSGTSPHMEGISDCNEDDEELLLQAVQKAEADDIR